MGGEDVALTLPNTMLSGGRAVTTFATNRVEGDSLGVVTTVDNEGTAPA